MSTCSYSIFFDHVDYFAKSKGIVGTVNLHLKDSESFVSEIEEVFYLDNGEKVKFEPELNKALNDLFEQNLKEWTLDIFSESNNPEWI